jgi:hypothetical protein
MILEKLPTENDFVSEGSRTMVLPSRRETNPLLQSETRFLMCIQLNYEKNQKPLFSLSLNISLWTIFLWELDDQSIGENIFK